jgi:hypothetical protein
VRSGARVWVLAAAILWLTANNASAEVQLKPFFGVKYGGTTTLALVGQVSGNAKVCIGANALWLGEVLGIEADVAHVPGFFDEAGLIATSGVTTYTGNVVIAMPRRMTRYTLRPYFVAGTGLMRAHFETPLQALVVDSHFAVIDIGGGATGFFTERVGVNWDIRHFGSVGGQNRGLSIGAEQLSFWRATAAVVIRF